MNVNGRDLVEISRERAHDLYSRFVGMVEGDPSMLREAAYRIGQIPSRALPGNDDIERELLTIAEVAKGERKAHRKAIRKGLQAGRRALSYSIVDPDAVTWQAMVDAKEAEIAIREAAYDQRARSRRGDVPTLASRLLDWKGLVAQPAQQWTVDGVLPEGSTVFLFGPSGVGKSFVAQSLAASVAGGFAWLGRPVAAGPVLYVFAEGAAGAGKRFQALADAWNAGEPIAGLRVLPVAVDMTSDLESDDLAALNREHDFALVIYDTLNRIAGDADENHATAMAGVLNRIERVRQAGSRTTSVVVHHTGKNGEIRGSSALWAAADVMLELSGDPGLLKLEARKQKDGESGVVGHFKLAEASRQDTLIVEGVAPGAGHPSGLQATRVEEALAHFVRAFSETGATRPQFVDTLVESGMTKKTAAHDYVNELIRSGRIVASTRGRSTYLELPPTLTTID